MLLVNPTRSTCACRPWTLRPAISDPSNDVRRHFKGWLPSTSRGCSRLTRRQRRSLPLRQVLRALYRTTREVHAEAATSNVSAGPIKAKASAGSRWGRRHRHQRRGLSLDLRPFSTRRTTADAPARRHGHGPLARAPPLRRPRRNRQRTQRTRGAAQVHDPLAGGFVCTSSDPTPSALSSNRCLDHHRSHVAMRAVQSARRCMQ